MDFGKPAHPEQVDWHLASDHPINALLSNAHPSKVRKLYIGSTAWGQKGFVGRVYPRGTKATQYLEAYGRQFNSLEFNGSFYKMPDWHQVQRWKSMVPEDFRFCPKLYRGISQAHDLSIQSSLTLDYAKSIQAFEQRLGPCFLQLPESFAPRHFEGLLRWMDQWPPHLKLALELRHPDWFGSEAGDELWAECAARGIGTVVSDVGARRDVAHMAVTASFVIIRWVGTLHESDEDRLEDWAVRLKSWFELGLEEAYMFTHQPEELPSAISAVKFKELMLQNAAGLSIYTRAPKLLQGGDGQELIQAELF